LISTRCTRHSPRKGTLVEPRGSARLFTEPDERTALTLPREAREVGVAKSIADACRSGEGGLRGRHLAFDEQLKRQGNEQIPPFDAVVAAVVEQAPGPRRPATGPGEVAGVRQHESQPEGRPGRTHGLAVREKSVKRTGQRRVAVRVVAGSETRPLRGTRGPQDRGPSARQPHSSA
jgi:hypothetical protein